MKLNFENTEELVQNLMDAGIVRHAQVAQVMAIVDRKFYLPKLASLYGGDATASLYPYVDAPQSIGHGQTISGMYDACCMMSRTVCAGWSTCEFVIPLISLIVHLFVSDMTVMTAPHMHAHVLEEMIPYLLPTTTDPTTTMPVKILDVGCGSGYLTACLGRLVHSPPSSNSNSNSNSILGRPGKVFGVDIYPELVARSKQNIRSSPSDKELLDSGTIQLSVGNGWEGLSDEAPFDAIHVGAAAEELPKVLAVQLKVGGVLIVPIGPQGQAQILYKVERIKQQDPQEPFAFDPTDYRIKQLLGVQYVPLVREL